MFIARMPATLRWSEDRQALIVVHGSYLEVVIESVDALLRDLHDEDPETAMLLEAELEIASPRSRVRVLLAPEATYRLRWRQRHPGLISETGRFLRRGFQTERIIEGRASPSGESWSALGDVHILSSGGVVRGPVIDGLMPIDLDSAQATEADMVGAVERLDPALSRLVGEDRERTLERLDTVSAGLMTTSPFFGMFVSEFTKVVVLQNDPSTAYSSGSNGAYVGRTIISNPQRPDVDAAELADSLIHEAIHTLLYMQEERQPWVLDPGLIEIVPRVESPWSGTKLPVRQFLQACCVWYGLLHFWALARAAESFPEARCRELMARSAGGFLQGPLLDRVADWDALLAPDIKQAIVGMQDNVVAAFTGVR